MIHGICYTIPRGDLKIVTCLHVVVVLLRILHYWRLWYVQLWHSVGPNVFNGSPHLVIQISWDKSCQLLRFLSLCVLIPLQHFVLCFSKITLLELSVIVCWSDSWFLQLFWIAAFSTACCNCLFVYLFIVENGQYIVDNGHNLPLYGSIFLMFTVVVMWGLICNEMVQFVFTWLIL